MMAFMWLSLSPEARDATLLFAPTHLDRQSITSHIREGLKEKSLLQGPMHMQPILKAKPMEPIHQRSAAYYQTGDVIRFNQEFKRYGIQPGQYFTVGNLTQKHRHDNRLPLLNDKGKAIKFALKHLPQYKTHNASFERIIEIYQKRQLELQTDDKIMWTRNSKADHIRNGEILTIHDIQNKALVLHNKDGQPLTLQKDNPVLQHADYGYVLTNYKVQGKDAPYGIGLMESYHRFGATMKNFYVQISRAIHGMTIVTDNKDQLIDAIKRNHDEKKASIDFITTQQLKKHALRFESRNSLLLQPVINKKIYFESIKPDKNIEALQFEIANRQKAPEFIKERELER